MNDKENGMKKFTTGRTYTMRSICDHNCIWAVKVLKRTTQFVTLKVSGEKIPVRCKVHVWQGSESCYPLGSYSMCPVLTAENIKGDD